MAKSFQSFGEKKHELKYPHVHLSFDDHSVSNWYSCKDLFKKYGAKAVFYVDSFHLLSNDEVSMLHELQSDGHVIGCHGKTHADATVYSKRFNIEKYIEDEILPAIEEMAVAGFKPTHFAFPNSNFDAELYSAISPIFCYIRPSNLNHFFSPEKMHVKQDRLSKENFYKVTRIREGKIDSVLQEFEDSAKEGKAVIIVLHDIRANNSPAHAGTHAREHVTQDELEAILKSLNDSGYYYETYQDGCKYQSEYFDNGNDRE